MNLGGAICLAAFFSSPWSGLTVSGFRPSDILFAIGISLIIVEALIRHFPIWLPASTILLSSCVLIISLINDIWAPNSTYINLRYNPYDVQPSSLTSGIQWIFAILILPLIAVILAQYKPDYIQGIAIAWCLGVAFSCLIAITDYRGLTSISAAWIPYQAPGIRQAGLGAHQNDLGVSAALAIPVAMWMIRRRPILAYTTLAALLVGVALSGSRGAQVAAAASFAFCLTANVRRARTTTWAGILGIGSLTLIAVGVGLASSVTSSSIVRYGTSAADASDYDRVVRRSQGVLDFLSSPISGIGLQHINEAHVMIIQLAAAGGFCLVLTFCFYLYKLVKMAFAVKADMDYLGFACTVSIVAWILIGAVENQLTDRYLYVTTACVIGMTFLRHEHHQQRNLPLRHDVLMTSTKDLSYSE